MKSILKKVKGVLKIFSVTLPALFFVGGAVACYKGVEGNEKATKKLKAVKESILKSDKVVELIQRDMAVLNVKYKNGELTTDEYNEKVKVLQGTSYVDSIISVEGLEDQKIIYDSAVAEFKEKEEKYQIMTGAGALTGAFSLIPAVCVYLPLRGCDTSLAHEIIEYAMDDLKNE